MDGPKQDVPKCSICQQHRHDTKSLVKLKVGAAEILDAPRIEKNKYRYAVAYSFDQGTVIGEWGEEEKDAVEHNSTKVGAQARYNAYWSVRHCQCGATRHQLLAATHIRKHTELHVQKYQIAGKGQRLMITFDGGGRAGKGDEGPAFGSGCAVFLHDKGIPILLRQFPVICRAHSAQEAEAAGSVTALRELANAVELARGLGHSPCPPHIIAGDSANTIAYFMGKQN